MADKMITTYNSHQSPTTDDKFFMVGASEEYLINYDLLASAILDKLTTKTYGGLNNSTVISALQATSYSTVLSASTYNDKAAALAALDSYANTFGGSVRVVGYISTANSNLLGLSNTSHYFDFYVNSASYRLLVARPVNGNTIYQLAKQGGTWGSSWQQLAKQSDVATNTANITTNTTNIATNTANIATNAANIATNTANVATNTASIATNTTNIATNASNITENATNIAGLATGVTNKVVKTTLSTTQTYADATTDTYNYLSVPGISDYEIVMVRADCANLRQWLTFVNGDNTPLYLREYAGTNSIRGGYYVDWTNERIGVRYLGATGAYTSANVYFTNVVGFVKQGAIDGSGSSDFTPYQALYDAIIAYIDEHYTPSSSDSVPNEVKQAIYTLFSKAAYTETGLTDELAVVESWTATTFNITNSLTNCASSNSATVVNSRTQYTATLTANTGYVLNTVTVTMGGVDITSTAYSSGTITIPSVTGNIVITATAVPAASSLSAVYTQSGSVYETTALNDLKNDLVVTATYSDSSTATIPSADYTLSGTLEVGTSIITVEYSGKTATFNVTVSETPAITVTSGLPLTLAWNSGNTNLVLSETLGNAGDVYTLELYFTGLVQHESEQLKVQSKGGSATTWLFNGTASQITVTADQVAEQKIVYSGALSNYNAGATALGVSYKASGVTLVNVKMYKET